MAKMLLINPKRRARRSSRRRNPSAAQLAARAKFAAMARARSAKRRKNPGPYCVNANASGNWRRAARSSSRRRRRNPVTPIYAGAARRSRRRRNPISLGNSATYIRMIKEGLIGGAGAVAIDLAMGQINQFLPSTLQRTPGAVGVGDAVKAVLTVAMGHLLRGPTKGISVDMARGALAVQAHGVIAQFLPAGMTLGYAVAAPVANMSARIGPNRLGRYVTPGVTPMLSRFTAPGTPSPMLSSRQSTMMRESMVR